MKSCPRSPQISAFLDLQILFLKAFPSRLGNCVFDLIRAKFRWYEEKEDLIHFHHTTWIVPRLNQKTQFLRRDEKLGSLKLRFLFRGYEEKGKVPLSNGGPFSFPLYPLNFAPFKSKNAIFETRRKCLLNIIFLCSKTRIFKIAFFI